VDIDFLIARWHLLLGWFPTQ